MALNGIDVYVTLSSYFVYQFELINYYTLLFTRSLDFH